MYVNYEKEKKIQKNQFQVPETIFRKKVKLFSSFFFAD
jgi:hypothetical protein